MSAERAVAIGFRLTLVACAVGGVWWIVADPAGPAPLPVQGSGATQASPAAPHGPQVRLESAPVLRTVRGTSATGDVTDRRTIEAERRESGLRPVLENLQGEPVYVEGIDGPGRRR